MKKIILLLTLITFISFTTKEETKVKNTTEVWFRDGISCHPGREHLDDLMVILRYEYNFPTGWYYQIISKYKHPGAENWIGGDYYEKTFEWEIEREDDGSPKVSCTQCQE